MKKLNNKTAEGNKKTSVFPYTPDTEPINLDCVDTTSFYDENGILHANLIEFLLGTIDILK